MFLQMNSTYIDTPDSIFKCICLCVCVLTVARIYVGAKWAWPLSFCGLHANFMF